ncbi:MAG: hypothetical protein AABW41_00835 [Nanoarchaeota archaeon]
MKITTVKVYEETKNSLDRLRTQNESYDQVIKKLISKIQNKDLIYQLIEAYKEKNKQDLEILEEWENTSNEV